jgi:uncharacterized membrane protein
MEPHDIKHTKDVAEIAMSVFSIAVGLSLGIAAIFLVLAYWPVLATLMVVGFTMLKLGCAR